MQTLDTLPLRQCVLAVSVLGDLDLSPADQGVLLPGSPGVLVTWPEIREVIGGQDPGGPIARHRVSNLLRLHLVAIEKGLTAAHHFRCAARVLALPPGHADHLGPNWVRETLRGGALDLGVGVHGLLPGSEATVPVPVSVLRAIQAQDSFWWPGMREHAERMGSLSAIRLARDGGTGVIRPVGGCDVLTLLSSRTLRRHLADSDNTGMRALAVPTRDRAWFDVRQVDPAFVRAAWQLTDEPNRGIPVPLLVTADEVALPFILGSD